VTINKNKFKKYITLTRDGCKSMMGKDELYGGQVDVVVPRYQILEFVKWN
jgi:hypothetical protein